MDNDLREIIEQLRTEIRALSDKLELTEKRLTNNMCEVWENVEEVKRKCNVIINTKLK